jgi:hypothetical protein
VDFVAQPKRYTIPGISALAAALMLSAPAQAANNLVNPCDQVGRDLQSLEVPVDELTVDVVDHATTDAVTLDEQAADADPVAPILYLTPRVTNILRDVFGTTPEELPRAEPEQPSSSPVADSDEKSDTVEAASRLVALPFFLLAPVGGASAPNSQQPVRDYRLRTFEIRQ